MSIAKVHLCETRGAGFAHGGFNARVRHKIRNCGLPQVSFLQWRTRVETDFTLYIWHHRRRYCRTILALFIVMASILFIVFFCCEEITIKIGVTALFLVLFLFALGISYSHREEGFEDAEKEYYALIALADNEDYYNKYRVEVDNRIEKYNEKVIWARENQNNWFWDDFVNDDIVEYLDTIEIKGGK